jgi:hypothetical protein
LDLIKQEKKMVKDFFTIPDPELSQESSVDPMGLETIWTGYGQAIFERKLTTIANDIRIYTFNLFHNHVINKLFQDYTEEIYAARKKFKAWQTELDVKAGLLIFLEDLVTHIFHLHENHTGVEIEKLGILGSNKVKIVHHTKSPEQIMLAANKRLGLLKNQLSLGMTGRYKGPMMNMQFFDRSFTYIPKTWVQVDKFMLDWTEAVELENEIIKLITNYLLQSRNKEYPQLSLAELKENRKIWKSVADGYVTCFGSRKLPKEIRKYWQDKLGLLSGAPKAIYDEIGESINQGSVSHHRIFLNARKHVIKETAELYKIDTVLSIEPFLSHAEYLFRYLAQPGIKNIKDEEKNLETLRKEIIEASHFTIDTDQFRLKQLHAVMVSQGTISDWLNGIMSYHKKLMDQRGGNMWFEIVDQNNIKHYFAPVLSDDVNTIPKYLKLRPWWHHYYLETVQSIYLSLN